MWNLVSILGFFLLNAKINRLHAKAIADTEDIKDIVDEIIDDVDGSGEPVTGIGKVELKTVEQVTNAAWSNRQTGREKNANDAIHWGVGPSHYVYIEHIKWYNANHPNHPLEYAINLKNELFGAFFRKEDLRRFVKFIYDSDGYLEVNS